MNPWCLKKFGWKLSGGTKTAKTWSPLIRDLRNSSLMQPQVEHGLAVRWLPNTLWPLWPTQLLSGHRYTALLLITTKYHSENTENRATQTTVRFGEGGQHDGPVTVTIARCMPFIYN